MKEKSKIMVGRCTARTAFSTPISPKATSAMAPSSATPVRSSRRNGSPPPIMPA